MTGADNLIRSQPVLPPFIAFGGGDVDEADGYAGRILQHQFGLSGRSHRGRGDGRRDGCWGDGSRWSRGGPPTGQGGQNQRARRDEKVRFLHFILLNWDEESCVGMGGIWGDGDRDQVLHR